MIKYVKGNLFDYDFDVVINTVNCVGVMGKGIALEFKKRYPEMFVDYRVKCRLKEIKPGRLSYWYLPEGKVLINFPTKRHWKNDSRYEDIASGLKVLRTYLFGLGSIKVGMPPLGCGNGGLDFKIVSSMIESELFGLKADITVFLPEDYDG